MPIGLDIKRIPQKNLVINGYQIPAGVITSVKDNVMLFLKIGFVKSVLCTCCFVWLFREQIFRFKCLLRCEIWFIKVITKLPNSEQSYKGKVQTHNYINRQNQSTTGKL
jgi:hypothetical protein